MNLSQEAEGADRMQCTPPARDAAGASISAEISGSPAAAHLAGGFVREREPGLRENHPGLSTLESSHIQIFTDNNNA
jgi:hypothetical protein